MFSIRCGVFETNSSSVHAMVICTAEEYKQFKQGELWFLNWPAKLVTKEEAAKAFLKNRYAKNDGWNIDKLMELPDEDFEDLMSKNSVADSIETLGKEYYETFDKRYTTPGGEEIVAFGYYGHD